MKVKVINLTPHDIVINDGTVFPPSGMVARVDTTQVLDGDVNGIPVMKVSYGDIVDLPAPKQGVVYIVSALVLSASKAAGRTDCVAPNTSSTDVIRNDKGQIVSVPSFIS